MRKSFVPLSRLLLHLLFLFPALTWAQETSSSSSWSKWEASTPCCGGFQTKVRTCQNADACVGPSELNFTCSSPDDANCGNGGWSEWENHTACCERIQVQTRTCLDSSTSSCEGSSSQVIACSRADVCYAALSTTTCTVADPFFSSDYRLYETVEECCATEFSASNSTCLPGVVDDGVDDGWTDWTEFTPCCNNRQSRNRTCTYPDGIGCDGLVIEEINCAPSTCNVTTIADENGWSEFSNWTECCGGMQTRFRSCNNASDLDGIVLVCSGEATEYQTCFPDTCMPVVNGNWSDWGAWSECCNGIQSRNRTCDNPAPEAGGSNCVGEAVEEIGCAPDTCSETAVVANWSEWSEWGPCCNGTYQRFRVCVNSSLTNTSEESCQGPSMEETNCSTNTCNVTNSNSSGWGEFGSWGGCCFGSQRRVRICEIPPCTGSFFDEQECTRDDDLQQCFYPVSSTRQCQIITDSAAMSPIQSYFETLESCCKSNFPTGNETCMAVDGDDSSAPEITWGNWTEWNTCCFGKQSRYRVCSEAPCEGSPVEERACSPDVCGLEDPFSESNPTTTSGGISSRPLISAMQFLSTAFLAM